MRKIVSILLFLILSSSARLSFSQGQESTAITAQFNSYSSEHLVEKLFVHTDRSFYLAGETIWFKLYCFNGLTNRLLDFSKVAYIDLIDDQQQSVLETTVKLDGGTGSGSLSIPMSQTSGNFTLRAYTRWMQNEDPEFFFHKNLTIVNPLISLLSHRDTVAYDVQFFPEGGELVAGLQSLVAFRAIDQHGRGIDFSGVIFDSNGNPAGNFAPERLGMGKFILTPGKDLSYHAVIKLSDGHTFQVPLPPVKPSGLVMHLVDEDKSVRIVVNGPGSYEAPVTLFVHTRSSADFEATHIMGEGKTIFLVDKRQLGEGISHFTLFDALKRPVCERLFFIKPAGNLDIQISSAHEFGQRSPVDLNLSTRGSSGNAEPANLSVSVYRVDSLQQKEAVDLPTWLWLFSDLHGAVESPEFYLHTAGSEALDLLMLTHGWRRFLWTDVLSGKNEPLIAPEYRYPFIHIKVTDQSGKPAGNVAAYLTAVGKYFHLQRAVSDSLGNLLFEEPDFYGARQIVVRTEAPEDSLLKFSVELPYASSASEKSLPEVTLDPGIKDNLRNRSIWMQGVNAYWEDAMAQYQIPKLDSTLFYGTPDETYLLDNYTRFPVMEEVLREYVPGIYVRRIKGHFVLHTLDINHKEIFDAPLILLDGVPVPDPDKIMAFDPLKIRQLDVKESKCYDGQISATGVISFFTYHGDLADFKLDNNTLVADYAGLELDRQFYSPRYTPNDQQDHVPDFRTTLFWSPQTNTNANGESKVSFFTGDVPGDYAAVIQGVGDSGDTGTATEIFHVADSERP